MFGIKLDILPPLYISVTSIWRCYIYTYNINMLDIRIFFLPDINISIGPKTPVSVWPWSGMCLCCVDSIDMFRLNAFQTLTDMQAWGRRVKSASVWGETRAEVQVSLTSCKYNSHVIFGRSMCRTMKCLPTAPWPWCCCVFRCFKKKWNHWQSVYWTCCKYDN